MNRTALAERFKKEIFENWLGKITISMQMEGRRCILRLRGLPPFYSKKWVSCYPCKRQVLK